MQINSRPSGGSILPRLPDTQGQTVRAGQRLNQFNGQMPANRLQALLALIAQLLRDFKGHKPAPDPIVQPVYGAIQPPPVQPVYGAIIEPPKVQPVYGGVVEAPPTVQPVYGAIIASQ
ncbi:MAG: hypothetical protein ACFCUG_16090 [Thiotrichales bacterium]